MAERIETAAKIQHPLAVTRTELVWEGKYDSAGNRVAPLRVALPFQTVETVNESAAARRHTQDLFAQNRPTEWRNRLIWGDKKYVLPSLLAEFAGKVNLIYIDPPFDTGADFSFTASVPNRPGDENKDEATFTKEPSIIEHKAYRDTWGRGLDSYLQWFYEAAVLLHELLHETGSVYVHLDWHVSFYVKAILDEIFGPQCFVNEVVWKRQTAKGDVTQGAKHMGRIHESIFLYTKRDGAAWNMQYTPYDKDYVESAYRNQDSNGRRYTLSDITAPGGGKASKGNPHYEFLGVTRYWRFSKESMQRLHKEGRIVQTSSGAVPRQKRYLDEMPGVPLQDLWLDISPVQGQSSESLGYSTQKPEPLLERIVKLSSNEGDLVFDCFCGSGTTAAVAEKLKRRWITCDLGRFAIHTARKRLLSIPGVRPFIVQNLGKYERQLWQAAEFGGDDSAERAEARQRDYVHFILGLYQAKPLSGYSWLHGVKGGRMVHVGAVDAPVSVGDVAQIAAEFKRAIGTGKDAPKTNGVDLLGWDFAFEMNEVAKQQAASANIQVRFLRIPHDAMDKRAVEQGDIHFFELAALTVDTKIEKRDVALKLSGFVIPPDDVPEDVQRTVKHWSQWIDYWAVDWDNKGDTFHNEWQTYRTRNDPKMQLETRHTYDAPGEYTVVVKVIDILGNDTTKTVKVKVK
ncbi:MAG: site-specific DNA-methyltransferase [Verrucomicrobiota bacterium]|jgi:DNA modification methylase